MGKPAFPMPLFESLYSRETVMRMAPNVAMNMTWERGRPVRIASPRAW